MIVVTGGCGFIGANLVAALNQMGETDILIVDHLGESSKHLNLNALSFADIMDKEDLFSRWDKIPKISKVFHLGACSATTEKDGDYILKNNYEYSKTLFSLCQRDNIPFIYASSASVYGNGNQGFVEEPQAESPLNLYAFSKWQFDRWVNLQEKNSQVVGLRFFNVFGPCENHKGRMASVVWQFHQQIQSGNKLKIFEGSEGFLRDFIHVDDVVKVQLFFAARPQISGVFNLGTGVARSFMDIAEILLQKHPQSRLEKIPFPDDLKGKYQKYTCADLSKLREVGYQEEFISLEEGVESYAQLLMDQDGYLRPI